MSKNNTSLLSKPEIVLKLTWYEEKDLLEQLSMHIGCLKSKEKQLIETQEERGVTGMTDDELFAIEEFTKFTRNIHKRLLSLDKQYEKQQEKKRAEKEPTPEDVSF